MTFLIVLIVALCWSASFEAKTVESLSFRDLIELTVVSAHFPYALNGSVKVIGIKSPGLLELPIMPLDLSKWAHIDFYIPAVNQSQNPHWNVTFHLSESFFNEQTYLAFQFYDRLLRFEPDVYVSGKMLTIGQLQQFDQVVTLPLQNDDRSLGTAVVSWKNGK